MMDQCYIEFTTISDLQNNWPIKNKEKITQRRVALVQTANWKPVDLQRI